MSFSVKVIGHSLGHLGKELVSLQMKYPRFIHSELLTHRALGRNASSSRAIPVEKMIAWTQSDPAMFVRIGKNQKGMQARQEVAADVADTFNREWLELRDIVIGYVGRWAKDYSIAKEIANRALEPWHHIEVIATASMGGWRNLFDLRRHEAAQPEFRVLADLAHEELSGSIPHQLKPGEWHLPYIHAQERHAHRPFQLAVWSAARCARVSYLNHEGKLTTPEEDEDLFRRLALATPAHLSPLEHQAVMAPAPYAVDHSLSGNLDVEWLQFRKLLERCTHVPEVSRMEHLAQFVNNPQLLAA